MSAEFEQRHPTRFDAVLQLCDLRILRVHLHAGLVLDLLRPVRKPDVATVPSHPRRLSSEQMNEKFSLSSSHKYLCSLPAFIVGWGLSGQELSIQGEPTPVWGGGGS